MDPRKSAEHVRALHGPVQANFGDIEDMSSHSEGRPEQEVSRVELPDSWILCHDPAQEDLGEEMEIDEQQPVRLSKLMGRHELTS